LNDGSKKNINIKNLSIKMMKKSLIILQE
jgi:hypothetical protein